jgi:hypothetical protein
MMSDGDVATISVPTYATYSYLAIEVGYQSALRFACALDENLIYGSAVALFSKWNPLVNQINTHLSRCLEGGITER